MRLSEFLSYDNIVIQCHDFPDADTIASGFALYTYLVRNGKKPQMIYSGKQAITKPNLILMLEALDIPLLYVKSLASPDLLITVDCSYGEGNVTKFDAEQIAVIDHHIGHPVSHILSEVHSNYGSCSSLMFLLLREVGFDINEDSRTATALFFGLYMDTNGLSEMIHPVDRDLRDYAKYDHHILALLKNSNLSLKEMQIAGDALMHYRYNSRYHFAFIMAKPCDPNILGFISDLLLQVDQVDTCVVFCFMPSGIKLSVRSCVNDIRASEIAEYLTQGKGTGGGHAQKAGGFLSTEGLGSDQILISEFLYERLIAYHNSYEVIYAKEFTLPVNKMKKFIKLPIVLGYVPSTELYPTGTSLCVRTLEADINLHADEDIFIVIGIFGEVYPIHKDKFFASHKVIDAPLEIKSEYLPTVLKQPEREVIELLPYAHSCVSRETQPIYAMELNSTVKIFTEWDSDNYMLGRKGDYLASRMDDEHDIYIIRREIFEATYREDTAEQTEA